MNILILGCSHTAGSWCKKFTAKSFLKSLLLNNIHKEPKETHNYICKYDKGWPVLLANEFKDHKFYVFAHTGGGLINYIITLGYLNHLYGKDFFDKVICQYTTELRMTLYNIQHEKFINNFPKNMEIKISSEHNNINIFDYNYNFANKKNENCIQLHNSHYLTNTLLDGFIKNEVKDNFIKKIHSLQKYNQYSKLTSIALTNILENYYEHTLVFDWYDVVVKRINEKEENLYNTLIAEGDGYHLTENGMTTMYELFKKDFHSFINNNTLYE